jgi:hypothetical protein
MGSREPLSVYRTILIDPLQKNYPNRGDSFTGGKQDIEESIRQGYSEYTGFPEMLDGK